jgi:adenosylcobyric acid synthase
MLGHHIYDPLGIESAIKIAQGLALLEIETTLHAKKQLKNIQGTLILGQTPFTGYEIHAGITTGTGLDRPVLTIKGRNDGAISKDNQILGCYTHGLFNNTIACKVLLDWAGMTHATALDYEALQENELNRLADVIEEHLDFSKLDML